MGIKVSVVMSVYAEPIEWIEKAIFSILNQTFTSFEFIIVNDNPKRLENAKLLNKFKSIDKRIKILENNTNIGLTKSLNKALLLVKGEYIARMDADDISLPNRFKKQIDFLNQNKNYVACGTRSIMINEFDKNIGVMKVPISFERICSKLIVGNPMAHPTLMIRKKVLTENNLQYDETLRYSQDYNLIRELIKYGKLFNLKEKLLLYRVSSNQITSKYSVSQQENANIIRERIFNDVLLKQKIKIKIKEAFFDYNVNELLNEYRKNKSVNSNKILKELNISLMLNSSQKVNTKEYFFAFISPKVSIKNKLRLLKKIIY
ncbi:glycosyltransferase [Tenacibaculum caenipelagi]|uniref:Glycosyl transferase family 2 n=1 Tax=Tenacibaculum caenipelagi TaxID=1325435 RepID=A0A4R6TEH4_9FLAO|nr:glycosyltransferase [Tenacibaculum caenipelagi]TDQ24100.1 glycosyl transferase family 2 [Tenacibaculum caenipelagi]